MKKLKKLMGSTFIMSVLGLAMLNLSTCCMFWSHQPKVPESLLK